MVLDVDALCVVPSFIYFYFLLSALDLLCFALLRFAVICFLLFTINVI